MSSPNKMPRRWFQLLFILALAGLWGCYNNAHLRTQRLLEPNERVVSGSGVLSISPEEMDGDPGFTGVAGLRGEVALLIGREKGEAGLYAGIGLNANDPLPDYILGGELKRYHLSSFGSPWKFGLQGEINLTPRSYYRSGKVLHNCAPRWLRPPMSTEPLMPAFTACSRSAACSRVIGKSRGATGSAVWALV
ncbi:MAG: hypothetical protein ACETWG_04035 [Candidatus Neomarinimicrobiota bacterium]